MLPRIWSSAVPRTLPTWTLQPFRFFSLSCYRNQANLNQDQNAPISFKTKLKEYPELYKICLAGKGTISKELWAKIRAEPELLRVKQEEARRNAKKLRATNPRFRAMDTAKSGAFYHAHKHDEAYVLSKCMSAWCFRMSDKSKSAWMRENLPWKTHLPHHQSERSYHFYSCCGIHRYMKTGVSGCFLITGYSVDTNERVTNYISGQWRSKTDPDEFLCHKHYLERGWDAAMAEGYEDVRSFRELRARYEELNSGSSSKP